MAQATEETGSRTQEWDPRIKIGMMVEITGYTVKGRSYGNARTTRIRWTLPAGGRVKVMVLGRSVRFEGKVEGGWNAEDPTWLRVDGSQLVWMVQPVGKGSGMRYRKPLAVY